MRISIQLQNDNGSVVKEVMRPIPQESLDRVVAAMRAEFGNMEGTGVVVFEAWANEQFNLLKVKVRDYEMQEAARTNTAKDMF